MYNTPVDFVGFGRTHSLVSVNVIRLNCLVPLVCKICMTCTVSHSYLEFYYLFNIETLNPLSRCLPGCINETKPVNTTRYHER